MDIVTLFGKLDISLFGVVWAKLRGGWKGVGVYIVKALTKLLKTLPADELRKYSELVIKVMELVSLVVTDFVPAKYRTAGIKTVDAIRNLANHIKDGEYTEEEFDEDIDAIEAAISAWAAI